MKNNKCDICGKEDVFLESLLSQYKTKDVEDICSDCRTEVNDQLGKLQGITFKTNRHWLKKFISNMKKGFKKQDDENSQWQDQPTKGGYYWFKHPGSDNSIIVKLRVSMSEFDGSPLRVVYKLNGNNAILDLINSTGKWYGPITPPKED